MKSTKIEIEIKNACADLHGEKIISLLEQIGEHHHKGRPDLFRSGIKKYNLDALTELLENPARPAFVAAGKNSGETFGYVLCEIVTYKDHPVLRDMKTLYIDDLCVDEQYRNHGIGCLLVEKCKEFAKEAGCYNIDLNVWEFNQSAIRFYEKCGMTAQRRRMEFIL